MVLELSQHIFNLITSILGTLFAMAIAYVFYGSKLRYKNKFTTLKEALSSLEWLRYICSQHSLSDEHTFKVIANEKRHSEYLTKSIEESIRNLAHVRFLHDDRIDKLIDDFETNVSSAYFNFYWECERNLPIHDENENAHEYDRLYCKKSSDIYLATCAIINPLKEKIKLL